MEKPIIKISDLTKNYIVDNKPLEILKSINIEIYKNEMIAIMGKSGSGKSTLLNILACIDKPTKGEYVLDNVEINSCNKKALAKIRSTKVGIIFQNFNLVPDYNALDNVKLSLLYKSYHTKNKIKSKEIAMEFLEMVGLKDKCNKYPYQLSGGEQQRVAIARTLATDSSIILADEPTGALDTKNTDEILKILKDINLKGKTIIIVTHDKKVADCCDKTLYMEDGWGCRTK